MKKNERGILTVEASIVLTFCVLFILFLLSFVRIYNAQSVVSHAVLQSSDAVALESFLREKTLAGSEADVIEMADRFMGTTTVSSGNYTSLRSAAVPQIAKEKFIYAIGKNETEANNKLKKLGIKDGLDGVDFSQSRIELGNDDVIVYVTYSIKMQFPVFGMEEIPITKAAKSKTFGDILFGIEVVPENPIMGTASGSGNYKHGTQAQISATPNYGYKFKKWSDGSTDNPRIVTVTGAHTYIAVFEQSEFGVNLVCSPEEGGTTSGGGTYKYLDSASVSASPAIGYHFSNWSIFAHKDGTTKISNSQTALLNLNQSYTCTANFEKNSYTVNVEISGATGGNAYIIHNESAQTSVTVPYQSSFKLSAPDIYRYRFIGWKDKNSGNFFSLSPNVELYVPAENTTYVACYESTLRTVRFFHYSGNLYTTRQVYEGETLGGNMPEDPYYTGYRFNGWKNFNAGTTVYNDMDVYGNWSLCTSHKWGHCGVKHYFGYRSWWPLTSTHKNKAHYVYWASCIRCVYCRKLSSKRVLCGTHWEIYGPSGWYSYKYVGPNDCGSYNLP